MAFRKKQPDRGVHGALSLPSCSTTWAGSRWPRSWRICWKRRSSGTSTSSPRSLPFPFCTLLLPYTHQRRVRQSPGSGSSIAKMLFRPSAIVRTPSTFFDLEKVLLIFIQLSDFFCPPSNFCESIASQPRSSEFWVPPGPRVLPLRRHCPRLPDEHLRHHPRRRGPLRRYIRIRSPSLNSPGLHGILVAVPILLSCNKQRIFLPSAFKGKFPATCEILPHIQFTVYVLSWAPCTIFRGKLHTSIQKLFVENPILRR